MLKAEDAAFSRLIAYAAYQWPDYIIGWHHRLIARKLEAVERGEIKRLMIFMPPRHGKSMLASQFFPAWFLGRNPDKYVVTASNGQDLADDFGRHVKNQIADPVYRQIFPGVGLSNDSRSSRRFHVEANPLIGNEVNLKQSGAYFAVGIGGPLTGRGAHLLMIDDPVKDREQADSETYRRRIKDWYTSVAYTRLMKGGAVIVIQTRWHEDDLAGWLLKEHAHEGWDVLSLPAVSEQYEGGTLWPEFKSQEEMALIKQTLGPRDWSALFQQSPAPQEGTFFKREWFKRYRREQLPRHLNKYLTSDHAPAGEDHSDFNCARVWGVDPLGDLWMVDGFRRQNRMHQMADLVIGNRKRFDAGRIERDEPKVEGLLRKHEPFAWFPEDDNNWKSSAGFITRIMREEDTYVRVEPVSPHGHDKPTKAQAFQGMAASGRVWIPEGPEGDDVIDQYLKFPAGTRDDEVDAASVIGRVLANAHPAIVAHKPEPAHVDRWDAAFNRDDEDEQSWKVA